MQRHRIAYTGSSACGAGVLTCAFEKPEGYEFVPGQYFMLELETSEGPVAKPFSHAAAPHDDWIEITTHLSGSPFKQALLGLEPGDEVWAGDAAGRLVLPVPPPDVVFLIGGVGITPVRSMVRHAVRQKAGLTAIVLYGNRSAECIPYREELDSYASEGIDCIHVLERPPADWSGASGLITPELVAERVADIADRLFVTAGPPGMVAAMEACMDDLGIDASSRLVERFAGY